MKKVILLMLVGLCGCSSMNNTQAGALTGGLLGTIGGTVVGLATGNPRTGAVVGGLGGAGIGALVGNEHDKAEARQAKAAAAYAANHPPVTMADVINMTHNHVEPRLIIDQIRATNSYYNLNPNDITMLRQQAVSEQVVSVMISRRGPDAVIVHPRPASHVYVVEPPPPPVSVGVGVGFTSGPRCRRW